MKTYHYLLIIAAVLGIWYYISKKKKAQNPAKEENKKPNDSPVDTSENADVATTTYEQALAIMEKGYADCDLSQDLGDSPENKWTLGYTDEEGIWHLEILSKQTFDKLVEKGYEASYN